LTFIKEEATAKADNWVRGRQRKVETTGYKALKLTLFEYSAVYI